MRPPIALGWDFPFSTADGSLFWTRRSASSWNSETGERSQAAESARRRSLRISGRRASTELLILACLAWLDYFTIVGVTLNVQPLSSVLPPSMTNVLPSCR